MSIKHVGIATAVGTTGAAGAVTVMAYLGKLTAEYGLALGLTLLCAGTLAFSVAWLVLDGRKTRIAYSKEIREIRMEQSCQYKEIIGDQSRQFKELMERAERREDKAWSVVENNSRAMTELTSTIKG